MNDRDLSNSSPDDDDLRFHVEHVFTLTGRGTAVIGHFEAGRLAIGDRLRVLRADREPGLSAICTAIEGVRIADRDRDRPAPIGLIIPGLQVSEIESGDVLVHDTEVS